MGAKLVSRGVLWLVPISDLVTKLTVGLAVYVPVMALLFIVLGKVPPVRALLLALIAAIALSVVGVLLAVMVVSTKP